MTYFHFNASFLSAVLDQEQTASQRLMNALYISGFAVPALPPPLPSTSKHLFNRAQTAVLEMHFEADSYPTKETRLALALSLGVKEYQVANWFQNRRSRKKQKGEAFGSMSN